MASEEERSPAKRGRKSAPGKPGKMGASLQSPARGQDLITDRLYVGSLGNISMEVYIDSRWVKFLRCYPLLSPDSWQTLFLLSSPYPSIPSCVFKHSQTSYRKIVLQPASSLCPAYPFQSLLFIVKKIESVVSSICGGPDLAMVASADTRKALSLLDRVSRAGTITASHIPSPAPALCFSCWSCVICLPTYYHCCIFKVI